MKNTFPISNTKFEKHVDDTTEHITASERTTWNSKANGTHTHTTAQVSGLDTALAGKADTNHTHSLGDLLVTWVVETSHNGSSWYRKWSDGFIEQGGVGPTFGVASSCTVTLNVPFTTTSYTFQGTLASNGAAISHNGLNICRKTTSTVELYSDNRTGGVHVEWYACGF